jgi:hypothetical protein
MAGKVGAQQGRAIDGGIRGALASARSDVGLRPGPACEHTVNDSGGQSGISAEEDFVGVRHRSPGVEEDGGDLLGDFFSFIYFSYKWTFMW